MSMSKELLLAILSMDSYNQGYGRGIEHGETQIGTATLLDYALPSGYQAAGFYAAAYDTQYGKVISYRGTDNPSLLSTAGDVSDILHGWMVGAGMEAVSPGRQSSCSGRMAA